MAFSLRWKVAHNELGTAAGWKLDLDDPVQPNAQSLIRLHAECALEHFSTMSTFVYIPLRKYLLRDDALFLPHVVIPLVHR